MLCFVLNVFQHNHDHPTFPILFLFQTQFSSYKILFCKYCSTPLMFLYLLAVQDDTICDSTVFDCETPVLDDRGIYVLLTEQGFTDYVNQNIKYSIDYIS